MAETYTLVVVEDNPDELELLMYALREHAKDETVRALRDGAQALEFAFGEATRTARRTFGLPRLVLLDLKLPKVGGLDVLAKLRSDPDWCAIPIIVLSASNQQSDITRAYELGASSYLVKPVDLDEFTELIQLVVTYWLRTNRTPMPVIQPGG